MNSVQLVGRLSNDPEIRYTDGGSSIARFSVACQRRYAKEGQPDVDFITCVAFGKTAEFIEKYFIKGQRIGLTGRIQTGSYEKDGVKHYTTDIVAENVEFVESKKTSADEPRPVPSNVGDGFMNIADGLDSELPF
ncbi:MAG: single-stranded DNA-binding protein [Lachnospiraceae bacterium]